MKPSVKFETTGVERVIPATMVSCRALQSDDGQRLARFMAPHETVSFCPWQDVSSTKTTLRQPTSVAFGAFVGDTHLVGAIVGGCMGTRAIVNHLAVHPAARGQGIGDELFTCFKAQVRRQRVRRVFLFVDSRNSLGRRFWEQHAFQEVTEEQTLELDI